MSDYPRAEHYPRAPHTNYNHQVYLNLESSYMPTQETNYDTAELNTARVNNVNGHTSHLNGLNGFSMNYGNSLSEISSLQTNNLPRNGPNGISVNTTNLPLSNLNIINTSSGRIICVANAEGNISIINKLAEETGATAVIHTGDFGFYEKDSLERISDRTLRHIIHYNTYISPKIRHLLNSKSSMEEVRRAIIDSPEPILSEFPYFKDGKRSFKVPVYTIWGQCEDVSVLEKFRTGEYRIPNLHILDEANTYLIDIGGVNLRLFGLGGAIVQHKLFDNGDGKSTIAGGGGTMWTTMLQVGELVETAQKVSDKTETRVLVTLSSPGIVGLVAQLALVLRVDFTISSGIHFRYCISYNEFSIQHDHEHFRKRLEDSQKSFYDLWDTVKNQVEASIDISQRPLLNNALAVVNRVPVSGREEPSFKGMWHFNLPDASYGWVLLNIKEGRISEETKALGFNFAFRRNGSLPGALTSPTSIDVQAKRQQTQWQSPAIPPQPSQNGTAIQTLMLTSQRSTSPVASPDLHSHWKQPPSYNRMELPSPTEMTSSSQKAGIADHEMERTPSKVNGNDTSVNETINFISNNNETASIISSDSNNIDGNQETKSWADQTQNEDLGESSQSQFNGDNPNNRDSNSSVQQNRQQYNNNRRANGKFSYSAFSVQVGNLTVPVSENEIQEFFTLAECQVERVKLVYDRNSKDQQLDHCYVDFIDGTSLEKAIQLNGQPFGTNLNPLKIRKADPENRSHRWRGRGRGRGNYKHRGNGQHGNNGSNHVQNGSSQ